MKCSDNVKDLEDQSNSYENEELQLGGSRNKWDPLNSSWTEKGRFTKKKMLCTLKELL